MPVEGLSGWGRAPGDLPLPWHEVHVWRVALDASEAACDGLRELLTDDERRRADRYRFDHVRRQFTVCRGTARLLIGRYLGLDPRAVVFAAGPHGKPHLAPSSAPEPLHFNVSHSGSVALLAFYCHGEIGVDVEAHRPLADLDRLAARSFSPGERQVLKSLPTHLRPAAFFDCWSRKEAFIKCTGQGLSQGLASFDVTLAPDEPARLLRVDGHDGGALPWALLGLPAIPGYATALAVAGPSAQVQVQAWNWDNAE
jgi:4'-phosphopantetheinyl transferase